jgi:hypothetical protein
MDILERALSMINCDPEKRFMAVMTEDMVLILDSVFPAVLCARDEARYDLLLLMVDQKPPPELVLPR